MNLVEKLKARLQDELPGSSAHKKVMSYARNAAFEIREERDDYREGGVLALLYPEGSGYNTVMIVRSTYEGVHSGQIAFPGGAREPEDLDLTHTALREAEEEIALSSQSVQVLGALTEVYIPPSNFIVHPVVGFIEERPQLIPDDYEVAGILHVPMDQFTRKDAIQTERLEMASGMHLNVGAYRFEDHIIWGATAMMMSELAEVCASC